MKNYGIFLVIYFTVVHVIYVCESKCDEYMIVFKEKLAHDRYELIPININELAYSYNTSGIYEEINKYKVKGCLLELGCEGSPSECLTKTLITNSSHSSKPVNKNETIVEPKINNTNKNNTEQDNSVKYPDLNSQNCSHHNTLFNATNATCANTLENEDNRTQALECKTVKCHSEQFNHTVNKDIDSFMYNVNVIYVNDNSMQNKSEHIHNKTKTQSIVYCDHAEKVCINKEDLVNNKSDYKPMRNLNITLRRELTSTIQPIFTGYFPEENISTEAINSQFSHFKTASLICELTDNYSCDRSNRNTSIKEISDEPGYYINVYIKTNYIQNNTRVKYSACTRYITTDNNSLDIDCHAQKFKDDNLIFSLQENYNSITNSSNQTNSSIVKTEERDSIIWYCQETEFTYTNNTNNEIIHYEHSLRYFECPSNKNFSDKKTNAGRITLIIDKKEQVVSNTTNKFNETKLSVTNIPLNAENISTTNQGNFITVHIFTKNKNNCSQISLLNITQGRIIDLDLNNSKNMNEVLQLKLSTCIDDNPSLVNNAQSYQQTELAIILNNDASNIFNSKGIYVLFGELSPKNVITLTCVYPNTNLSRISYENETTFECEFINWDVYENVTHIKNNNTKSQKYIEKDKVSFHVTQENQNKTKANTVEYEKVNCTSNKTECEFINWDVYENVTHLKNNDTKSQNNIDKSKVDTKENEEINCTSNKTKYENKCCVTKECDFVNIKESTDNYTRNNFTDNKAKIETKTYPKNNNTNIHHNNENLRQNSLGIEKDNTEKILLIVIASTAGALLIVILALRKCGSKGDYTPAPTREMPDEAETAF